MTPEICPNPNGPKIIKPKDPREVIRGIDSRLPRHEGSDEYSRTLREDAIRPESPEIKNPDGY